MAEKNLVEEALIQIQNLEEAINENAKEILHSTMKEEISELVKESMKNEAEEEDEFEVEDEIETDDESEEDESEEDESEEEFDFEDESDEDESEEDEFNSEDNFDISNLSDISGDDEFDSMGIQDLSDESMDTVLKAFKEMKPTDTFEIKKDGDFIHLKDEEDEYLIQTESEEDEFEMDDDNEEEEDEIVYEIEMDEAEETDEMYSEENEEYMTESAQLVGLSKGFKAETHKGKAGMKPKIGKDAKIGGDAKNYGWHKNTSLPKGFKEDMPKSNPTKGTGKPKFEFKEGDTFEMPSRTPKLSKEEAKEASRTYGMGWREGALKKGAQAGQKQARLYTESMVEELEMLKVKNEEYRKALNMFRDKLNEVAVFNSNLAYATRLFTEHSTSKQEKINVLRRFDSAESLKESKALYRTIKEELGGESKKFVTESIEKVIDKSPQSGSAVNLIESKTYENPQFLRMKDIMSKIIK
ncbi:hypothetical protein UFOVP117_340 [uncultured Caudovirales phage]|uniref:Uncharacterized protein n=1 Tax=uncultured Caudovirales phage TaxID=2100421 RepID=A0A6J5LBK9_9CAUD|nr:hypothetical protein UFOVP117_340 [uncultured Caudovirales phage]